MISDTSRWRLAPLQTLLIASFLLLVTIALATWLATRGPWLGVKLIPADTEGLQVTKVDQRGPLAGRLHPGDHIRALIIHGRPFSLKGYDHHLQPHAEPTFQHYNTYLDVENQIAQALRAPTVTLIVNNDQPLTFEPALHRPLSSLPWTFWLLHTYGLIAFLIGLSVWVFLPANWPPRLLAISGSGMFLATWQHSLWEVRELALPAWQFDALMRLNHIGVHLLLVAFLVLLIIYPKPLKHASKLIFLITTAVVLQQINENTQMLDLPLHSFYLPLVLYYPLGITLVVSQWRRARNNPLDRAALRWVFLSILIAMGAGLVVYFLPVAFKVSPIANPATMVGLVVTLYLGFALGILRYRLFQLERWWFTAWAWFLGGLTVVLVDILVISAFGLNHAHALAFSVIAVGWVYFPVRQWLWRRLAASSEVNMERHLPDFVEALYSNPDDRAFPLWQELLRKVFQPLSLDRIDETIEKARLAGNGSRLLLPSPGTPSGGLCLLYGQGGRRLFGKRDTEIAQALVSTAKRINNVRQAREAGAIQERQRIMRDLHDDVGGRLLTLIHTAPNEHNEELARNALTALREAIHALDHRHCYDLQALLEDWYGDLRERLGPRFDLNWSISGDMDKTSLPPRHYINLRRILDESVTNALKHGVPNTLTFNAQLDQQGELCLLLRNEVNRFPCSEWSDGLPGRGLSNMRTRIEEISGELSLYCVPGSPRQFCMEARIPLPKADARYFITAK